MVGNFLLIYYKCKSTLNIYLELEDGAAHNWDNQQAETWFNKRDWPHDKFSKQAEDAGLKKSNILSLVWLITFQNALYYTSTYVYIRLNSKP